MKNFILLLSLLSVYTASAQKDIKTTLHKPANGDIIYDNVNYTVLASFKNVGNVVIPASDSILIQFIFGGSSVFQKSIPHGDLLPGDSVVYFEDHNKMLFRNSNPSLSYCLAGKLSFGGYIDVDSTNDLSCNMVKLWIAQVGLNEPLGKGASCVYPNPSRGKVHFVFSQQTTQVTIIDVSGRQLICTTIDGTEAEVDMTDFADGIYTYVALQDGKKVYGRFVVNHSVR